MKRRRGRKGEGRSPYVREEVGCGMVVVKEENVVCSNSRRKGVKVSFEIVELAIATFSLPLCSLLPLIRRYQHPTTTTIHYSAATTNHDASSRIEHALGV